MKINEKVKLVGKNVILVPYQEKHVSKYHEWMKSEELQKLTASEPLNLEQEYEMQKSWQLDEDKCTFIVLNKSIYEKTKNEIVSMIGDTNIFKKHHDDRPVAEIEIMIAEIAARGKHLGWESVVMMLLYGIVEIKLLYFQAKILLQNEKSIKLFKKLGFSELSVSEVFGEVTFEKHVTNEWVDWLKKSVEFKILPYD